MEPLLLSLLEELLSLTEEVKDQLEHTERDRWLEISAEVADLREDVDAEVMNEMELEDE